MSKFSVKDENNDHKYFSILQNILSRIGLTAFERSVYWAIKECAGEKGSCTKSYGKLAEMAGMSEKSLKRTLTSLSEKNKVLKKSLISIKNRVTVHGDPDTNEIILVDLWSDNINHFQKIMGGVTQSPPPPSPTPPPVTQTPGVGSHRPQVGSHRPTYKDKEQQKNQYQEEQQQDGSVVVFFDCLVQDKRLKPEERKSLMRYSEDRVCLAIEYSLKVQANKTLIQQLVWHCKQPIPPPLPTKSFWDAVREYFKNYQTYMSAICFIDDEGIAFHRGNTHLPVKFAERNAREKFMEHLKQFDIKWVFDA